VIHIPLPTQVGRKEILEHYLSKIEVEKNDFTESAIEEIAGKMAGLVLDK